MEQESDDPFVPVLPSGVLAPTRGWGDDRWVKNGKVSQYFFGGAARPDSLCGDQAVPLTSAIGSK